jgi:hypothetical protein
MKGASPPLRMSHSLNLVADWLVLFGAGSSSASGAVRNLAEEVGSPPPSTSTWRGLEASTKEKTWLSIRKVDFFDGEGRRGSCWKRRFLRGANVVGPTLETAYRILSEGRVIRSFLEKTDKICTLNDLVFNG